jgi:diguanylate cyclase (GGDEF)-like protein
VLESLSRQADAAKTARKILRAISRPFRLGGRKACVSASVGIAVYPGDGASADILLRRADRAMYRAKKARGNDYRFWSLPQRRLGEAVKARPAPATGARA